MTKSNNNTINLTTLEKQIKAVQKIGDQVVIDEKADKAIAEIYLAKKKLDDVLLNIKSLVQEGMQPFNAKSLKGKYVTISIAQPRADLKYKVDPETGSKFAKQVVTYKPDVEAIDKYVEEKDQLPQGVSLSNAKETVRITPKLQAL